MSQASVRVGDRPVNKTKTLDIESLISSAKGNSLSVEQVNSVNSLFLHDELRRLVGEEDLSWIKKFALAHDDERDGFYISLLRYYSHYPEIKNFLKASWTEATTHQRMHLFWRLLDDEELESDWHRRLQHFVIDNLDDFRTTSDIFFGTSQKDTLLRILDRILDDSFPITKKWAYLYCIPNGDEYANIRNFLVDFARSQKSSLFTDAIEQMSA